LDGESEFPLQQFYLTPHRWSYFVQRRAVTPAHQPRRALSAKFFRAWWFVGTDVGLHLLIKLLASVLRTPGLIRFFFRHVVAKLVITDFTVIDHSDRALVMEHELFKHLEIEIFVPAHQLRAAVAFVKTALECFDGALAAPPPEVSAMLHGIGMLA